MTAGDDSFYRCYKALHLVTHEAIPCVDISLKDWHASQQKTLSSCTGQCRPGKKPKLSTSCQNCVAWANAIESVYYQPTTYQLPPSSGAVSKPLPKPISWSNINPTNLGKSHVEIAKAFALRLKKHTVGVAIAAATATLAATPPAFNQYTNISDFDSASVLMIMSRFSEFHKRNKADYNLIKKVLDIRNDLSHMAMKSNMHVNAQKEEEYFKDINNLVCCLETLYPQHFTSAQDVKTRLMEIQMEQVTEKMKEELLKDITHELQRLEGDVQAVTKGVELMKGTLEDLSEATQQISGRFELVEERIEIESQTTKHTYDNVEELANTTRQFEERVENVVEEMVSVTKHAVVEVRATALATKHNEKKIDEVSRELSALKVDTAEKAKEDKTPFDEDACRRQLMAKYRQSRSKLPLFPGTPEELANMDDLYIQLELVQGYNTCREDNRKQLPSYEELFSLKDKDNKDLKRILIIGSPGGGKTTTISKIAYDWTKQKAECHVNCKMLFALDLRDVEPDMSLIEAIRSQLSLSVNGLFGYTKSHARSIIFLLDGFDEASWLGETSPAKVQSEFKDLLNTWLDESCVIVTTRPHTVSNSILRTYTHVRLKTLSDSKIEKYIYRFFKIPTEYLNEYTKPPEHFKENIAEVKSLLACLKGKPKEKSISHIPILLTMMCVLWTEKKGLPDKITDVFEAAILYLTKHNWVQFKQKFFEDKHEDELEEELEDEVNKLLDKIGEIALKGLLEDNCKARLVFQVRDFKSDLLTLNKATTLGLVTKEQTRSKWTVTFLHKTFQEFCAAKYLASLETTDKIKFRAFLSKITSSNISDVHYMMQFCCGLSNEAAKIILPHFGEVLKDSKYFDEAQLDCSDYNSNDPFTPALLLFYETQSQTLYQYLHTLFQIPELDVKLGNHWERLSALDYFLKCQAGAPADSILSEIPAARIDIIRENNSNMKTIMRVCGNLLHCMSKLGQLDLSLPKSESDIEYVARAISKLRYLKKLVFSGSANLTCFIDFLNNHTTCSSGNSWICSPQITHLTISCTTFNVCSMKKFMSQLVNLTTFSLLGGFNKIPKKQDVAGILLNSLVSRKLENLSITYYHVPVKSLRPFLSTLYMLHLEEQNNDVCKELFSALYDIGRKAFRSPTPLRCQHLRLNCMENVSIEGVKFLAKAFQFMPCLAVLNLRKAYINTDGLRLIAKALPNLKNLMELNLSNNFFHDDVSLEIARSLKELPRLEKIFMRSCFDKEGVVEFSKSLRHLQKVRMLNLNETCMLSSASDLFMGIQKLQCLQELNLRNTLLGDDELEKIPFKQLSHLMHLDIGGQRHGHGLSEQIYTVKGVQTVFEHLHHLEKLTCLKISHHEKWRKEDPIWEVCYRKCLTETIHSHMTLILDQNHIKSVIAFVNK